MFVENRVGSKRKERGPLSKRLLVRRVIARSGPRAMHTYPSPLPGRNRFWEREEDMVRFWLPDWLRAGTCVAWRGDRICAHFASTLSFL
jgi:hypothetical protein